MPDGEIAWHWQILIALLADAAAAAIVTAVGLPLEGLGLILTVERVLDMCRTTVNVRSDSCGAAVIARSEGEGIHTAR